MDIERSSRRTRRTPKYTYGKYIRKPTYMSKAIRNNYRHYGVLKKEVKYKIFDKTV